MEVNPKSLNRFAKVYKIQVVVFTLSEVHFTVETDIFLYRTFIFTHGKVKFIVESS